MVCHRCVPAVEDILQKLNIFFSKAIIGEIHLMNELPAAKKELLRENRQSYFSNSSIVVYDTG